MTTPAEPARPPVPAPEAAPKTGLDEVDTAMAAVTDLEGAPLDEHADRLARAHESLHGQLQGDRPS